MNIKAFIIDVDGTLTDGAIIIDSLGVETKHFNVKDGLGISLLHKMDITPVILTGRMSNVVSHRCLELGIEYVYQGIKNKKQKLQEIIKELNINYQQLAYVGDDLNDIEAARMCGLVFSVNDACEEMKKISHYITSLKGGQGALRECVEWLIKKEKLDIINLYNRSIV